MKKFFDKVLKTETKSEMPNKYEGMCTDDIIDFIYNNYATYQDTATKYRENGLVVNDYNELNFAINRIKEKGLNKYLKEKEKLIATQNKYKDEVTALETEFKMATEVIEKRYKIKFSNPYGQLLLLRKLRME